MVCLFRIERGQMRMRLACSIRVPHQFDAVHSSNPKDHSHWGWNATLGGKYRIVSVISCSSVAEALYCPTASPSVSRLVAANEQIDNSIRQNSIDIIEREFHDLSTKSVSSNLTRSKDKKQVSIAKTKALRNRCGAWIECPISYGQAEVSLGYQSRLAQYFRKRLRRRCCDPLLRPLLSILAEFSTSMFSERYNGFYALFPIYRSGNIKTQIMRKAGRSQDSGLKPKAIFPRERRSFRFLR